MTRLVVHVNSVVEVKEMIPLNSTIMMMMVMMMVRRRVATVLLEILEAEVSISEELPNERKR